MIDIEVKVSVPKDCVECGLPEYAHLQGAGWHKYMDAAQDERDA
jgi:hypothetical protein